MAGTSRQTWHLSQLGSCCRKQEPLVAGLIRQGFITRPLVACNIVGRAGEADSAEFPGTTPSARFIMSVVTRKADPIRRKPLRQKAADCRTRLPLPRSVPANGCPEALPLSHFTQFPNLNFTRDSVWGNLSQIQNLGCKGVWEMSFSSSQLQSYKRLTRRKFR